MQAAAAKLAGPTAALLHVNPEIFPRHCSYSSPVPLLQVQAAAAQLADRAAALLDVNERALALRTGGLRDMDDDRDGRGPRDGGFGDSFGRR